MISRDCSIERIVPTKEHFHSNKHIIVTQVETAMCPYAHTLPSYETGLLVLYVFGPTLLAPISLLPNLLFILITHNNNTTDHQGMIVSFLSFETYPSRLSCISDPYGYGIVLELVDQTMFDPNVQ